MCTVYAEDDINGICLFGSLVYQRGDEGTRSEEAEEEEEEEEEKEGEEEEDAEEEDGGRGTGEGGKQERTSGSQETEERPINEQPERKDFRAAIICAQQREASCEHRAPEWWTA